MFVTLSTYFYVGARMLNYSRKDVVYTNKKPFQIPDNLLSS
jgi:hypothetical protein